MTAEELIKNKLYVTQDDVESVHDSVSNVLDVMIDFAKIHVAQALVEAVNNLQDGMVTDQDVNIILKCYPLNNIK